MEQPLSTIIIYLVCGSFAWNVSRFNDAMLIYQREFCVAKFVLFSEFLNPKVGSIFSISII